MALGALITVSLICDFLMVPIVSSFDGQPQLHHAFGLAPVGCILAQGSLLAAWLVLSQGPFWQRLMRHWCVAAGLWFIWFLGVALSSRSREIVDIGLNVAFVTPLVSLGAQTPLWIARHFFGWRLAERNDKQPTARDTPLSILDLMLATLLVALAFGLVRVSPAGLTEPEFWAPVLIGTSVAAIVSTLVIVPAAVMLLRPRPWQSALWMSGAVALAWVSLEWLVIAGVRWYGGPLAPYAIYLALSFIVLSYAGTCMLAAYVARERGYFLAWGGRTI
jgi:hypothetical protein